MKSNDGIFFHHGSENEGTCFLGDSLNKNISTKKILRLLNEESSSQFEVFWKTSASKSYKSSHQEVFSKIGVMKILTSLTDCIKFRQNAWETSDEVHL